MEKKAMQDFIKVAVYLLTRHSQPSYPEPESMVKVIIDAQGSHVSCEGEIAITKHVYLFKIWRMHLYSFDDGWADRRPVN